MQVVLYTTSLKQRKRYRNNNKYKLKKTQTMKKNTMNYSAPEVELVEVAVESGFQTSLNEYGFNGPLYDEEDVEW